MHCLLHESNYIYMCVSLYNTRALFKFYLSKILNHHEGITYFQTRKERTPLISSKSNILPKSKFSQREIIKLTLIGRMLDSSKFWPLQLQQWEKGVPRVAQCTNCSLGREELFLELWRSTIVYRILVNSATIQVENRCW
jgi:hypothetical protein